MRINEESRDSASGRQGITIIDQNGDPVFDGVVEEAEIVESSVRGGTTALVRLQSVQY